MIRLAVFVLVLGVLAVALLAVEGWCWPKSRTGRVVTNDDANRTTHPNNPVVKAAE